MDRAEIVAYLEELNDELRLMDVVGEVCLYGGAEIPWFVSGMENLKAIASAESPLSFRWRKIFVMEIFLSRV